MGGVGWRSQRDKGGGLKRGIVDRGVDADGGGQRRWVVYGRDAGGKRQGQGPDICQDK